MLWGASKENTWKDTGVTAIVEYLPNSSRQHLPLPGTSSGAHFAIQKAGTPNSCLEEMEKDPLHLGQNSEVYSTLPLAGACSGERIPLHLVSFSF